MCLGAPKIVTSTAAAPAAAPLRQASRNPYGGVVGRDGYAAQDALRRRMGLASTILTSPLGATGSPTLAAKTLLGA
jgi:hypothetical protein